MEYHDHKPVSKHQAWFRKHVFEIPEADAVWLAEDTVQLWLVLGVSRDSSYAKRRDQPETKVRTCIIDIDTVAALTGELRDQAIGYIAQDRRGELVDQTAQLELDRLTDYLHAQWPDEPAGDEQPVDVAIRLLDQHQATPVPPVLTEPVAPSSNGGPKTRAYRPDQFDTATPTGERVGSIYRTTTTRDLLHEAFGD